MSVLVSDRQKLTRDEVDEGFHLLAELDRLRRQITQTADRLAELGVDAAPVPTARNGGTVVLRADAPGQATIADVVSQGERVAAVVLEQMKHRG